MQPPHLGGPEDRWAIGFDVGGTKIAAGVVAGDRLVHRQQITATRDADRRSPASSPVSPAT